MKTIWTILGTMVAASLIAQDNTNLPAIPAPVSSPAAETAPSTPAAAPANTETGTPAAAPVKHKKMHKAVKRKPSVKEPAVILAPGPAEVNATELVVRGQAGLKGELVTHLHKGDTVNVLEEINLAHHEADEPSQWAKISYPTNGSVWVSAKYVDASGTVTTKKLNLRAGRGENYSVVGVVNQGTSLTVVETKGEWTKVIPPASAYAFVAAKFLTQEANQTQVANTSPTPPENEMTPTPTQVAPQPQIVMTPPPPAQPPQPTVRIVQHQGVIGPVGSMTAPTGYKLYDPGTGEIIDFLYPTSPDQDLSKLVDAKVIVTGEEGIDARWPNTPVIAIQNIQVIGTNAIQRLDLTPPKRRH